MVTEPEIQRAYYGHAYSIPKKKISFMHFQSKMHMSYVFVRGNSVCVKAWNPKSRLSNRMMGFLVAIKLQLWSNFNDPVTTQQSLICIACLQCRDFLLIMWTTKVFNSRKTSIRTLHAGLLFCSMTTFYFLEPAVGLIVDDIKSGFL